MSFNWSHTRHFLTVAQTGSFSAASKVLGVSQPSLSRQISALEIELGITLFERVGKGLELTEAGIQVLEQVKKMDAAAQTLSLVAEGQTLNLFGKVCISATEVMAIFELPAILQKLRQKYPAIEIELIATNKSSDLKRREADIAVRAYRPDQADLIVRKLRSANYHLYGAKTYLEKIAYQPDDLKSLAEADFIGFDYRSELKDILNNCGLQLTEKNFKTVVEHNIAYWELVKAGLGLGVMDQRWGDREPLVSRIDLPQELLNGELWLVSHRELRTSRRVKVVFDFLVEHLQATS